MTIDTFVHCAADTALQILSDGGGSTDADLGWIIPEAKEWADDDATPLPNNVDDLILAAIMDMRLAGWTPSPHAVWSDAWMDGQPLRLAPVDLRMSPEAVEAHQRPSFMEVTALTPEGVEFCKAHSDLLAEDDPDSDSFEARGGLWQGWVWFDEGMATLAITRAANKGLKIDVT